MATTTYQSSLGNYYRTKVLVTPGTYNAAGNYTPITFELRADAEGSQGFAQWTCQGYLNVTYRNAAGASNTSRRVFTENTSDQQWITATGTGTTYSAGGYLTAYKATLNCYHDENGYLEIDFTGQYGMNDQNQSYSMPVLTVNVDPPIVISDQSIPAVATTAYISRSGSNIIAGPESTPTSSTGGNQTFTTYISKNGGAYVQTNSVSAISTDYAYAYVRSTFDGNTAQSPTVTLYGVPFAVSAPTISNVSTTNLTLSWTPPATNGSPILYYVIQATTDDGNSWSVIESNVTQTYKNLTGLTIAATYKFRIIAISDVGPSPDGAASVAQFISAYGYRFTDTSTTTPIVTAKIYVGIGGSGADENGYRSVQNIKKYTSGGWVSLET